MRVEVRLDENEDNDTYDIVFTFRIDGNSFWFVISQSRYTETLFDDWISILGFDETKNDDLMSNEYLVTSGLVCLYIKYDKLIFVSYDNKDDNDQEVVSSFVVSLDLVKDKLFKVLYEAKDKGLWEQKNEE